LTAAVYVSGFQKRLFTSKAKWWLALGVDEALLLA
jgi:hypothetical protein